MNYPNIEALLEGRVSGRFSEWPQLRVEVAHLVKELSISRLKNLGTLANNLCPDHRDKQFGQPCLACTIETERRKAGALQAEIDRLMLEYCPDDMTAEQVATWVSCQEAILSA